MNIGPSDEDADGIAGADWSWHNPWRKHFGRNLDDGRGPARTTQVRGTTAGGTIWGNVSFASGWTVEMRVKSNGGAGLLASTTSTNSGELRVYDGSVSWSNSVGLGDFDNSTDFHVFRMAQLPTRAHTASGEMGFS